MQMRKVTIHNNLDPVYTLLKTTELNSQKLLGKKMDYYRNFMCSSFPSRKNKPIKNE